MRRRDWTRSIFAKNMPVLQKRWRNPSGFCSSTCPDCAMVAQYLIALRQNSKKRKPKRPSSSKLLLRQLEPERRETAELVSLARAPQWRTFREEWLRGQIEILDRIDQVDSNIE